MKVYILVSILFFHLSNVSVTTACHDEERTALVSFKFHLSDPSNRLSSWHGRNCCNWHGVYCSKSLHVVTINLRNPNPSRFILNVNGELVPTSTSIDSALNGTISSSIFTLTHLSYLDLSFNNFMYSRIPPGIANLTGLTYLNLSNAMFRDSIETQLSNLTSLERLDLSCSYPVSDYSSISTNLSSSVTVRAGVPYSYLHGGYLSSSSLDWLQGLQNLRKLVLSGVDLSKASQSAEWANPISFLTNLRWLQLSNSSISGKIPIHQLLNLTHLSVVVMNFNPFASFLPFQLANLSSLLVLDLTSSNLHGHVPYMPQLMQLHAGCTNLTLDLNSMFAAPWPKLEILDVSSTEAVGSIPLSFGNTTSLVSFIARDCFIEGVIPSSLTNLSRLQRLQLNFNNLRGNIPGSLSNLKNLRLLSLMQNSLEGSIPHSICNISSLWYLALSSNKLSGKLPDCLSELPTLEYLFVGLNALTGTISLTSLLKSHSPKIIGLGFNYLTVKLDQQSFPTEFQPEILELSSCNIQGGIPQFLSNLTQLRELYLSNNMLSGTIPLWLFNLPNLGRLDLSFNNLEGFLPPQVHLNSYFGATTLNVANNLLGGSIPHLLRNIDAINLSRNNFTGYIPAQLGLTNARYLSLSGNKLLGPIPDSFCQKDSALILLDLSYNHLVGAVPSSFGNCTSLSILNLAQNNLSGRIPEALENARNLSYVDLTGNHFDGPFPGFIQKLKVLVVLQVGNNKFSGKIPRFIGYLQQLRILVLRSNLFHGTIPEEMNKLQNLQVIDFSNNKLSGSIPEKLDGLKTLITRPTNGDILGYIISFMYAGVELSMAYKRLIYQYEVVRTYHSGIDLSLNALTGNIPSELVLLKGLSMLNLSHNSLSGEIPNNIGEMTGLESLDLSFNNLTGEIPSSINLLHSLGSMNLSYNNLSGRIPSGTRFDTLYGDGSAYLGNKYLCDAPDGIISCDLNSTSSSQDEKASTEDVKERKLFISAVIFGYGVGLCGYFCVLYSMKVKWKERYWKAIDKIVSRILQCVRTAKRR